MQSEATMVKKRILDPIPILDEALLLKALREEGIKEVSTSHPTTLNLSHRSLHSIKQRTQATYHCHAATLPPTGHDACTRLPSCCPLLLGMRVLVVVSSFPYGECLCFGVFWCTPPSGDF